MNDEFDYALDHLNDYCLLHIIEFLNLKSKLKLHLTCKRLNSLITKWFNNQRAFGDLRYLQVELCTNKKHRLDAYQYSLRSITDNSITNEWRLNIMMLDRIFALSKNIECLHFNCLDDENLVNEKLIITILASLPKITCLSFGIGLQISSKSWNLIATQLGNQLQHLQINRVNYSTLENIVKRCVNLISLYIRFCPSAIGCVSYLWPKLRKLRIQSMATIYLRNAQFTDHSRNMNLFENEDDEETINLAIDEPNNLRMNLERDLIPIENFNNNRIVENPVNNQNNENIPNRAEKYLSLMNNSWYLNLVEIRLNRITVKSLTVLFNHCINLQVLDLVLFFNRASLVFENQDFIQLSYRLTNMRLFSIDIFSKWNMIQLDNGLSMMLQEWPKIEVLIIKRGLITENLFDRIKQTCKNLKVICIEFCDYIPYNHRLDEITDRIVDSLIQFTKLTKLRLHFTSITDNAVINLIENCKNLKYLDLYGCLKITDKSLIAISSMLNTANRCNTIFSKNPSTTISKNESEIAKRNLASQIDQLKMRKDSIKSRYNQKKLKSLQSFLESSSVETSSSRLNLESLESEEESINSNLYSCKQFDTINANCVNCGKSPKTFYLTINRTKIEKENVQFPNTLFIISEDDEIWNSCCNYQPIL